MAAELQSAGVGFTSPDQTVTQSDHELGRARDLSRGVFAAPGYVLLHRLGEGTFGEVWLAKQEKTGIQTAVKFFTRGGGQPLSSLQEEVRQLARLHADPGIVQLLDVEPNADPPYYVMALAERGSLAERLTQGTLPVAAAVDLFRKVAEALAYVHVKGIRHCDIKPGNILLDARGRPLLADFSQARLGSTTDPALGTFFWMAPEQADLASQPEPCWDVYALGAVLFAMLTGDPPFATPEAHEELGRAADLPDRLRRYRAWLQQAPRPEAHRQSPTIDGPLADLIDQCLALDPRERLPDAAALLSALARRETALAQLARREVERRQRPLLIYGFLGPLLLFLLMGGLVAWGVGRGLDRSEEALTEQFVKGNQVSAQLVAKVLEQELLDRGSVVDIRASRLDVRSAVLAGDRAGLQQMLERISAEEERVFYRWAVLDQAGMLLASYPLSRAVIANNGQLNLAWRDYFHGQGDRAPNSAPGLPPVQASHISQPFVSELADDRTLLAISTPVYHPEGPTKAAIGVFLAMMLVDELHEHLLRVEVDDGFSVVVDRLGHCVLHRDRARIAPRLHVAPPRWACPTYRAVRQGTGTTTYVDPVDGQTYLAGYAALPQIGWGTLYQHERTQAMAPMDGLTRVMLREGVLLLVLVVGVLGGMWLWLVRILRKQY